MQSSENSRSSRRPQTARPSVLSLLAGGLIGATGAMIAVWGAAPLVKTAARSRMGGVGLIVLMLVELVFALMAHELGHVLAALSVKFRFQLLVIGPLRVERDESERLRARWNRDLTMYGGAAASLPTDTHNLLQRFAIVIAGGPLLSLLLCGLALTLSAQIPAANAAVRFAFAWFGLACGMVFLATALPLPGGAFQTDGARLWQLLRGGAQATRTVALLTLTALLRAGVRPQKWEARWMEAALEPADGSPSECMARYFAYLRALDSGAVAEAETRLMRAVELLPGLPHSVQAACHLEAAYFAAYWQGRRDSAEQWFAKVPVPPPGIPRYEWLRAQAAVSGVRGDAADTIAQATEALRLAPASAVWSRARLLEMQARFAATQTERSASLTQFKGN